MDNDLKPCPFCGSKDVALCYGKNGWVSNVYYKKSIGFVECLRCGSKTSTMAHIESAVRKWNRRASDE